MHRGKNKRGKNSRLVQNKRGGVKIVKNAFKDYIWLYPRWILPQNIGRA